MTDIGLQPPCCWGAVVLEMKIVFEIERWAGSFPHRGMTLKICVGTPDYTARIWRVVSLSILDEYEDHGLNSVSTDTA